MSIENAVWTEDEYGCLNFRHQNVHAFIQKRPSYCDRGHWSFNADGVPFLDGADSFPRYFMGLDCAIREATEWLNWRLYNIPYRSQAITISVVNADGSTRTVA